MTVMASVALIGLIFLTAGLAPQDKVSLQTNLIKNGKGAYEDYVLAGERMRGSVAGTLVSYNTLKLLLEGIKRSEQPQRSDILGSEARLKTLEKLKAALKSLPSGPGRPTSLDYDQAIVKDFGPAWSLILRGNQKPRTASRSLVDSNTLFPELADFKSLTKFAMSKARIEFANGNASAALSTYRETYRFIQRIGSDTLIARLVTISCEAILFADIERNLPWIPLAGLSDFIADLRIGIAGVPRLVDCLAVEKELFRSEVSEVATNLEGPDAASALLEFDDEIPPEEWQPFRSALLGMPTSERRQFFATVLIRHDSELRAFESKLSEAESNWPLSEPPPRPSGYASTFLNANALAVTGIARMEAETRTRTRIAIITLLAREHAWQHGTYPASLKDFLPAGATIDPLTNQPYKYSIANGAVVVKTVAHPVLGEISLLRAPRSDAGSGSQVSPP